MYNNIYIVLVFILVHTYREENMCVDVITNYVLSLSQGLYILSNSLGLVSRIMMNDIVRFFSLVVVLIKCFGLCPRFYTKKKKRNSINQ